MHYLVRYLALVLLSASHMLFLSACMDSYVTYKEPEFSDNKTLEYLIGAQKVEVLKQLGSPWQVLAKEEFIYYIYSGIAKAIPIVYTPIPPLLPIPLWPVTEDVRYCVLLEFNADGTLTYYFEYSVGGHGLGRCDDLFVKDVLIPEWAQGVRTASGEILLAEANIGNAAAQWELYKRGKSRGEYNFKWLCKASEQGDYRAQWELGYLYLNGLYGVRKDLVLSVMWYGLVEADGHDPAGVDVIRKQLTPEQLIEAEHLYESWKPGQCEREIFGTEPRNTD